MWKDRTACNLFVANFARPFLLAVSIITIPVCKSYCSFTTVMAGYLDVDHPFAYVRPRPSKTPIRQTRKHDKVCTRIDPLD